jgi:aspartate/methionine/tyrosine aminotransferase
LAEHIVGGSNVDKWELEAGNGRWQLNLAQLENIVTDETKLIVVNFPHNPTGFLPTMEEFDAIIEIAKTHGAWLFCDEMYRGLEGNGHFGRLNTKRSTLPAAATQYERAISLSGLSKTHGLPGLRSGWLIIKDESVRQQLINWKFYTTICPPAPSEFLAMAALKAHDKLIARNLKIISDNLQVAAPFFARWPEMFDWKRPLAGSVALVGLNVPSATDYCHALAKEAGVLLLPSSCLGYGDKHVRMGFGRLNFSEGLRQFEQTLWSRQ